MHETYNILLVENDEKSARSIRHFLSSSANSFNLKRVHDLQSGLQEIENQQPDVILVDNSITLDQLADQFKWTSRSSEIPIIIISEFSGEKLRDDVEKLGAIDTLLKSNINLIQLQKHILSAVKSNKKSVSLTDKAEKNPSSSNHFDSILSKVTEGVIIATHELKIQYVNQAGHHLLPIVGEQKLFSMIKILVDSNEQLPAQWSMKVGHAQQFHFELEEISYHNEPHFLVLMRDKSKESEFERKADQFEKSYQFMYQSFPIPILIHDGKQVLDANEHFCQLLKYQKSTLTGMQLAKLIKEDVRFKPESGSPLKGIGHDVTLIDNTGTESQQHLNTSPFSYIGKVVYMTSISGSAAVKNSDLNPLVPFSGKALLKQLSDLIKSNFSEPILFNQACLEMGCRSLDLEDAYFGKVSNQQFTIETVFGQNNSLSAGMSYELVRTVEKGIIESGLSIVLNKKDPEFNKLKFAVSTMSAILASPVVAHGNVVGVVCFFSTERSAVEVNEQQVEFSEMVAAMMGSVIEIQENLISINVDQYLDKAYVESKEEINSKQLLKLASHDLKESVRVILNYTELVSQKISKDKKNEEVVSYLNYAREGAHKLEKIVEDFKFFLNMGEEQINKVSFGATEVVEEILLDIANQIESSGASFSIGNLPNIIGDKHAIRMIFNHLILNALKFNKEGEKPLVSISCQDLQDEWLFSVRDNGIGIDRNYHTKIFDIFQRLNSQHEFPGNGMGLTICSRFVLMHGGRIWVDSLPGYGSSFYFTIKKPADTK